MCGTTTAIVLTRDYPKRFPPPAYRLQCTLRPAGQADITVARFVAATGWEGSSVSMNSRPKSQDRVFG